MSLLTVHSSMQMPRREDSVADPNFSSGTACFSDTIHDFRARSLERNWRPVDASTERCCLTDQRVQAHLSGLQHSIRQRG